MLLLARQAESSERSCLPISQPITGTGAGIEIIQVPYIDFFNTWLSPATPVVLTVAENHLHTNQGTENLNMANLLGLTVTPLPGSAEPDKYGDRFPGLYGDTLKVYLRVPLDAEMKHEEVMGRQYAKYSPELTVPATIACMKENARRMWPRVRYLEILVQGNEPYVPQGGIFALASVVNSPWPHDWKDR